MKKISILVGVTLLLAFRTANTKILRFVLDADPKTIDIQEQLAGGMLQFLH